MKKYEYVQGHRGRRDGSRSGEPRQAKEYRYAGFVPSRKDHGFWNKSGAGSIREKRRKDFEGREKLPDTWRIWRKVFAVEKRVFYTAVWLRQCRTSVCIRLSGKSCRLFR